VIPRVLKYVAGLVTLLIALGGCAALQGDLTAPDVALVGLHMGRGDGMNQTLLVDLVIKNPNKLALKFNAMSYRIRIEGRELVSGTSREPLEIAAGGTQKYTVPATISLMSGFGLMRDLMSKPKNKIAYELNATLEPSGLFSLPISVKKADMFSFQ
jgi:LEA14-like dessication related protein